MPAALRRVLLWGLVVGGISFAVGYIGPILWAPEASQGPLLGIFVTGPLGTLAGLGIGVVRELLGYRATPFELVTGVVPGPIDRGRVLRIVAGFGGTVLVIRGVLGVSRGEGRAAAASIVVAGALLWYAAVGQVPAWFRR